MGSNKFEKVLFDYEVTSNMTLYARWSETDLFPIVFEQIGECSINCDNNITGDECSAYTDSKAIDTGFSLFSSENINLDFELSMDFEVDLNDPLIERNSTLVANKDEIDSVAIVYGFAFRVEGNYQLTYSNDAENATVISSKKALHSLRLVRKNNKLYYSFDGEELKFFADADVDHPFDSHLIFGAALNENQEEFRYIPGTISNIKVRLGKMN
jgi:hypothetical protein